MTTKSDKTSRAALSRPAPGLLALAPLMLILGGLSLVGGAIAQDDEGADPVNEIRTMQQEYISLRSQISKERAQAAETEQFLQDRIALVEQQIEIAREAASESDAEAAKTAESIARLETENDGLKAATSSLEAVIWDLEREVLELRGWMPEDLKEDTRTLAALVPATQEKAGSRKLYDRFITVVTILNQIDKFNTNIELVAENRKVGSDEISVTTMYIGVSHAFYATDDGTRGGYGVPSPDGYKWTPSDGDAAAIRQAIGIREGKEKAEFIELPFAVK